MMHTLILSLIGGVVSLGACLYYWKRGQFQDCEDVKYQMFRDEQE